MGHLLQALNASHTSPKANKLAALTYYQAVPTQCGSCRQWLAPVYPSDPPPPPELVLDPAITGVYQLSRCMEAAGGTGMLGGYSPVPAGWRDVAPAVSPKSPSTCLCLVHWAGAGHAVSMSVLCSGARSTPGSLAPLERTPEPRHTWGRSGRGHTACGHSACVSAEQSPEFLAGPAYTSYMIIACTAKLELKFPHMVLVDSFSSGFGELSLPPVT